MHLVVFFHEVLFGPRKYLLGQRKVIRRHEVSRSHVAQLLWFKHCMVWLALIIRPPQACA